MITIKAIHKFIISLICLSSTFSTVCTAQNFEEINIPFDNYAVSLPASGCADSGEMPYIVFFNSTTIVGEIYFHPDSEQDSTITGIELNKNRDNTYSVELDYKISYLPIILNILENNMKNHFRIIKKEGSMGKVNDNYQAYLVNGPTLTGYSIPAVFSNKIHIIPLHSRRA